MRWWILIGLVGCNRVDRDLRLADLTEEDATALCASVHRNAGRLTCGGQTFEVPESDDALCLERVLDIPVTCQATVEDFRACDRARRNDDPCMPSLQPLAECEWETDSRCFYEF